MKEDLVKTAEIEAGQSLYGVIAQIKQSFKDTDPAPARLSVEIPAGLSERRRLKLQKSQVDSAARVAAGIRHNEEFFQQRRRTDAIKLLVAWGVSPTTAEALVYQLLQV